MLLPKKEMNLESKNFSTYELLYCNFFIKHEKIEYE